LEKTLKIIEFNGTVVPLTDQRLDFSSISSNGLARLDMRIEFDLGNV